MFEVCVQCRGQFLAAVFMRSVFCGRKVGHYEEVVKETVKFVLENYA